MSKYIDLHTHTTKSDGSMTPTQLIRTALKSGISTIAITDHETIAGVHEALVEAQKSNLRIIPGIEISANYEQLEVHLLGYFIDINSSKINEYCRAFQNKKIKELVYILSQLNQYGIEVSLEEVKKSKGFVNLNSIIEVLIDMGISHNRIEEVEKYLKLNKQLKNSITPSEAISIIKESNGVAILAHPYRISHDYEKVSYLISKFMDFGLDGIEVFHSEHPIEAQMEYQRIAYEKGLGVTGGSDFHGCFKPHVNIGRTFDNARINFSVLTDLLKRFNRL